MSSIDSAPLVATCWLKCSYEDVRLKKNAKLAKSVQVGQLHCLFLLQEGWTEEEGWKGEGRFLSN